MKYGCRVKIYLAVDRMPLRGGWHRHRLTRRIWATIAETEQLDRKTIRFGGTAMVPPIWRLMAMIMASLMRETSLFGVSTKACRSVRAARYRQYQNLPLCV